MAYRDLDELLDGGLELPIGGKVYAVPPVDAETGLRLQRLHDWMFGVAAAVKAHEDDPDAGELSVPEPGGELLSDAQEIDMYRKSLGTAYDEMLADGVAWPRFKVAGMTAFLHHTQSAEAAEAYWNTGGRPEASAGESGEPSSGGPIDPATGIREWYEPDTEGGAGDGPQWRQILERWSLVELDLHEIYAVDIEAPGLLRARSWRWLRIRIAGLFSTDASRLRRALYPEADRPRP